MQEMKASPNVCSMEELKMYPLHLAIHNENHRCFLALLQHEKVSGASSWSYLHKDLPRNVVRRKHSCSTADGSMIHDALDQRGFSGLAWQNTTACRRG